MKLVGGNIIRIFRKRVESFGDRPALGQKRGGRWVDISWREYGEQVQAFALGLIALGVRANEAVSIIGFNRPEWLYADLATAMVGAHTAPVYQTSTPEQIEYILNHCEARVCVVENAFLLDKVLKRRDSLSRLEKIVVMDEVGDDVDPMIVSFSAACELGRKEVDAKEIEWRVSEIRPESLATLVYTSGTTGPPKAVMLSHHNIVWTAEALSKVIDLGSADRVISYLPLSHIAEHDLSIYGAVYNGYSVYFAESIEKLPSNLTEVRPTFFFAVPRIWEKFYAGVINSVKQSPALRQRIFNWALRVGKQHSALKLEKKAIPPLLAIRHSIASRLVYSKLKERFGLDRCRFFVTGAAPIALDILEFFCAIDMPLQEVYGQSEDCGPTSFNTRDEIRLGTVGKPIPGVRVKIDHDGEILVKGENVFMGYLKDKEETRETLVDGWLRSGDVGELDADGFLRITDRKKDLLITSGGKNVAPQNIESLLKTIPLVSQAVVVGDQRKYLGALLTLDAVAVETYCAENGIPKGEPADLASNDQIRQLIWEGIEEKNRQLAKYEAVKRFAILPQDFSIETGELTPTMKVKRKIVSETFQKEIESLYDSDI